MALFKENQCLKNILTKVIWYGIVKTVVIDLYFIMFIMFFVYP